MTKRHVQELSRVCEHLLLDAAQAFPALRDEFERDLERVRNLVHCRGISLFVDEFPAVAKHLDRCLDTGFYIPSHLPTSRQVNRTVVIPKLFRGLYLEVFNKDGILRESPSTEAVFFLRQLLLFAKKTELECGVRAKIDEVFEFLTVDYALPKPHGIWESDVPGDWDQDFLTFEDNFGYRSPTDVGVARFLENASKVAGILTSTLGSYDPLDWRFRHGPGAISEVTGPTNKFCWRNWSDRLESVFPVADCGYHNYGAWATSTVEPDCDYGYHNRDQRKVTSREVASRLICVPKTHSKPRLIAAEPSEHQWCQQNIWHYFCEKAGDSWIGDFCRFRDQSHNQNLCLEGSKGGALATLDLSSASDCVTCAVVEYTFGSNPALVRALAASRTRFVKLPENLGFHAHRKLNKFSTMGSAVTFPVESMVFLVISLAAILTRMQLKVTMKNIMSLKGQVTVFGDDIIVPREHRDAVVYALEHCMFKVNTRKSYDCYNFRESCGVDAFRGQDVTPVYWKGLNTGKPESKASTLAVHNNLIKRFLMHTAGYIASTVRKRSQIPYVSPDSGVIGFHCRTESRLPTFTRRRWNRSLHREENLILTLRGEVTKVPTNDDSALLQYFTEAPSPYDIWRHGVAQRPRLKLRRGWVATDDILARG